LDFYDVFLAPIQLGKKPDYLSQFNFLISISLQSDSAY